MQIYYFCENQIINTIEMKNIVCFSRNKKMNNVSRYIIAMLLLCCVTVNGFSQIEIIAKKLDKHDTLNIQSFSIDLDFQFYFSQKETDKNPYYKIMNAARCNYLFNRSDLELTLRQIFYRRENGQTYYNHYVNLSSGVFKYRSVSAQKSVVRHLYPEPVVILQNNTARGLQWRFQTGILFHPVKVIFPRLKVNFGLGLVYDWSSWEVNKMDKINAVSPEMKEKILFINSHTKLKHDMYQHHYEWRPMMLLNANYMIGNMLNLNLSTSYQQSLVSPFNEEIKAAYPELQKVYPYIYSRFSVNAKVYRGLAIRSTVVVDYENNNLSIYASSWEYSILFGVVWSFSNQKR